MFKNLPTGVKISITRSITITFDNYMKKIRWDENKYRLEDFVKQWRHYIMNNSSWYNELHDSTKANPVFHEQLASKINETIEKILSEQPTAEQIEQLKQIEQQQGKSLAPTCRSEAAFIINTYKK